MRKLILVSAAALALAGCNDKVTTGINVAAAVTSSLCGTGGLTPSLIPVAAGYVHDIAATGALPASTVKKTDSLVAKAQSICTAATFTAQAAKQLNDIYVAVQAAATVPGAKS